MIPYATIAYSGILIGDCKLEGEMKAPESMLNRTATPQSSAVDAHSVLNTLQEFLTRQHGTKASNIIDLKITVKTADASTGDVFRRSGFKDDPSTVTKVDTILLNKPVEAPPKPQEQPKTGFKTQDKAKQEVYVPCPRCKGTKERRRGPKVETCSLCRGSGQLLDFEATKDANMPKERQERLERESEDRAFSSFKGKRR
jgi:ribosomal protein L37AE/L43A